MSQADQNESNIWLKDPEQDDDFRQYLRLQSRVAEIEERLTDEVAETKQRVKQAEQIATTALKVVRELQEEHRDETKVETAKRIARNELLRRASMDASANQMPVSRGKVIELGKPEHTLRHQSVKDAFEDLAAQYECFYTTTNRGKKSLSVRVSQIPDSLAIRVSADIGREDIATGLTDMDSGDLVATAFSKGDIRENAVNGVGT